MTFLNRVPIEVIRKTLLQIMEVVYIYIRNCSKM